MPKKTATTKKKPAPRPAGETRTLPLPKRVWYNPFSWQSPLPVPTYRPLPKARQLFWRTVVQLWQNKQLFGGIILTYGILNVLLIRGLAGSNDLSSFKGLLDSLVHGFKGALTSSFGTFLYLLATSGSGNAQNSGVYQYLLLLLCSLAFIWAFRQALAKRTVLMRDSFYVGTAPFVRYLLMFIILGLQLIPLAAGAGLYGLVTANGIAVHLWERGMFLLVFAALAVWSLRMITGTVFATYIVTLPGMQPLKALRSASNLVRGRRLLLWRKIIFLPISLLLLAVVIEIPLILVATPAASWAFFILTMLTLPIVHGYLYNLYREML